VRYYIAGQHKKDRDSGLAKKIPMRIPERMSGPEGGEADLCVLPEMLDEYRQSRSKADQIEV
jgi:hypothetical protein